jgi:hypothetical protein
MPADETDEAVIARFDALVRDIHAANPGLTRKEAVHRAARRKPALHAKFIQASNPANRRAAVELTAWHRQFRRKPAG